MVLTKEFIINGDKFVFEFEVIAPNKVLLPNYTTSLENKYHATLSESEFLRDIDNLIPDSLYNDWKEACFRQLQIVIRGHVDNYKRITPSDIECYIKESLIVMTSIGQGFKQPLSINDQHRLFKNMLIGLSKHFNIPVEVNFAPQINFELAKLLDYGKDEFNSGNYENAKSIFAQINIKYHNHECYYWFARIKEMQGLIVDAIMYYEFSLEKYIDNPQLISSNEILKAKIACQEKINS